MVWLRLHHEKNGQPMLINMTERNAVIIDQINDAKTALVSNIVGDEVVYVKESLDEIEIMLRAKGEDVRRTDPHSRSYIGNGEKERNV